MSNYCQNTLLMLGLFFYQHLHAGGWSLRLLKPTAPKSTRTRLDTWPHLTPHGVLGPRGSAAVFCLLKTHHLCYMVGLWHLLGIGRCNRRPVSLSSHALIRCVTESERNIALVELSCIARSGNRFRLQMPCELVYVWKRPQRNYIRRKLLRLLSQVLRN